LYKRHHALIPCDVESEIGEPTTTAAANRLHDFIEETTPDTLAGVAVKRRHLAAGGLGGREGAELIAEQVLSLVERKLACAG
jgi:hypothetical protein